MMKRKRSIIYAPLIAAALVTVISCAVNPVTGRKQIMLMSEAQEVQLGLSYHPQVMATFGDMTILLFRLLFRRRDRNGQDLASANLEYHVKVVDSPVVNAFAVPGGYIYLTRGIMANLNNEAEFIGVLGHEMGHIAARHSVSQQTKQQLGTLLLIGG
jgi:predicted Zn-dependent protease